MLVGCGAGVGAALVGGVAGGAAQYGCGGVELAGAVAWQAESGEVLEGHASGRRDKLHAAAVDGYEVCQCVHGSHVTGPELGKQWVVRIHPFSAREGTAGRFGASK